MQSSRGFEVRARLIDSQMVALKALHRNAFWSSVRELSVFPPTSHAGRSMPAEEARSLERCAGMALESQETPHRGQSEHGRGKRQVNGAGMGIEAGQSDHGAPFLRFLVRSKADREWRGRGDSSIPICNHLPFILYIFKKGFMALLCFSHSPFFSSFSTKRRFTCNPA